jgi:hypothetical protein
MVLQTTIGAELRLTHGKSFNASRGVRRRVNNNVVAERLTPARFGRALLRFLHYTCKLRRQFPDERLLITKLHCKSAYWRVHLQAKTAIKSNTCTAVMLLVALRMTFGGAPNLSQWSDISEVIADIANDLMRRSDRSPSRDPADERSVRQRQRPCATRRGVWEGVRNVGRRSGKRWAG